MELVNMAPRPKPNPTWTDVTVAQASIGSKVVGVVSTGALGRAARVDADQFHVGVAGNGGFDAAAQVAVAGDADADGLTHAEILCW